MPSSGATPGLDTVLLQKVIEIAAAAAEASTAAAASDAAMRSEVETLRVTTHQELEALRQGQQASLDSLKFSVDQLSIQVAGLVGEMQERRKQRQTEIDDRRAQGAGRLKLWRTLMGRAVTPQSVLIIAAIFAAAAGIKLSIPVGGGQLVLERGSPSSAPLVIPDLSEPDSTVPAP